MPRNKNMKEEKELKIITLECLRCNHHWIPRKKQMPMVCPSCMSPYWNRARIQKKKEQADA